MRDMGLGETKSHRPDEPLVLRRLASEAWSNKRDLGHHPFPLLG
jgi:hypothetical protein